MKIRKFAVAACALAAVAAPLAGSPALAEDAGSATPLSVTVPQQISAGQRLAVTGVTRPDARLTVTYVQNSGATDAVAVTADDAGAFSSSLRPVFNGKVVVSVPADPTHAAATASQQYSVAGVLRSSSVCIAKPTSCYYKSPGGRLHYHSGSAVLMAFGYDPQRRVALSVRLQYRDDTGWHYADAPAQTLTTTWLGQLMVAPSSFGDQVDGRWYRFVAQAADTGVFNTASNTVYTLSWIVDQR